MTRGRSRAVATSKMEHFVIIVINGWKPLTFITKSSTLDVSAVLDPPLMIFFFLVVFRGNVLVVSPVAYPGLELAKMEGFIVTIVDRF